MTACSLEPVVITTFCVSSLVMLCQAFTADAFGCCLLLCIQFCILISEKHAPLGWDQVNDQAIGEYPVHDAVCLESGDVLFLLRTFPIILVRVNLKLICQSNFFQNCAG